MGVQDSLIYVLFSSKKHYEMIFSIPSNNVLSWNLKYIQNIQQDKKNKMTLPLTKQLTKITPIGEIDRKISI